ncbi:MAG: protoheme IX farnesyltransferase [Blastochloris sp.]|nr:protoheme IX farnesyltransferase [Blastochloris sp.]
MSSFESIPVPSQAKEKTLWSLYAEMTKLRLTLLVLFSALIGYLLGQTPSSFSWLALFNMFLGTYAVASGAAVLNQLLEQKADALMHRTRERPLPAGHLESRDALALGVLISGFGIAYLMVGTTLLTAFLATLTLLIYIFVYTPLKRLTSWNTLIGAIPGALPPLIGWSAARPDWTWDSFALFGILFFWQMPHFLAIAWLYKEDYTRGGFRMLTRNDPTGRRTAWKSALYATLLIPVSLIPYFTGTAGWIYLVAACVFGSSYLGCAVRCVRDPNTRHTRTLFLASLLYLPCVLILLVLNKR